MKRATLLGQSLRIGLPARLAKIVIAIGFDKALQQLNFAAQLRATLRVGHAARADPSTDDRDTRNNIHAVANGCFHGLEVMMPREKSAVGLKDQRVTVVAIRLGKGAVDRDGFAAAFER